MKDALCSNSHAGSFWRGPEPQPAPQQRRRQARRRMCAGPRGCPTDAWSAAPGPRRSSLERCCRANAGSPIPPWPSAPLGRGCPPRRVAAWRQPASARSAPRGQRSRRPFSSSTCATVTAPTTSACAAPGATVFASWCWPSASRSAAGSSTRSATASGPPARKPTGACPLT